jgi:hypothetical protein
LLLLYIGTMQFQIQTQRHFARKLNIHYECKHFFSYGLTLFESWNLCSLEAWGFGSPLLLNLWLKFIKFFEDQEIQFPIAFCPILLDLLYEHKVGCKYLNVQIFVCYLVNWDCIKWTPIDEKYIKVILVLSYYRVICLLIIWSFYSQNSKTIVISHFTKFTRLVQNLFTLKPLIS